MKNCNCPPSYKCTVSWCIKDHCGECEGCEARPNTVPTTNPSTTDWEPDWDRQFFYGSTAIPGPGGRSAKDHITMDVIGNEAMKRHIRTLLSRKEEEAYRKGREDESDESLLEHKRELKEKEKEVRKEVVEFIRSNSALSVRLYDEDHGRQFSVDMYETPAHVLEAAVKPLK